MIDDALRRLSPKSSMAKALAYGRKRWDALTRYLGEGMAEMDNSEQDQQGVRGTACPANAERSIRSIAIGRKNSYDHCQQSGHSKIGRDRVDRRGRSGWDKNDSKDTHDPAYAADRRDPALC